MTKKVDKMISVLNREQFKEVFKTLSRRSRAAFMVRVSLRVLPWLVVNQKKKPFYYWNTKEDHRIKYLLGVLSAQRTVVNFAIATTLDAVNTLDVYAAANAAATTAATISAATAHYSIQRASQLSTNITDEIQLDFQQIQDPNLNFIDFLFQP